MAAQLAGCGCGAYAQGNWGHSNAAADWDLDAAVCLQRSEALTEEDLDEITRIQRESQEIAEIASVASEAASKLSSGYDVPALDNVAKGLSVVAGMFSGAKSSSAEETVKERKFTACLENKGWESQ